MIKTISRRTISGHSSVNFIWTTRNGDNVEILISQQIYYEASSQNFFIISVCYIVVTFFYVVLPFLHSGMTLSVISHSFTCIINHYPIIHLM